MYESKNKVNMYMFLGLSLAVLKLSQDVQERVWWVVRMAACLQVLHWRCHSHHCHEPQITQMRTEVAHVLQCRHTIRAVGFDL